jgi:hypothetical protein
LHLRTLTAFARVLSSVFVDHCGIGGGVQRRAGHDFVDLPRRVEANLQVRFGLGAFLNASYMEFVCFGVCAERPAAQITAKTTDNEATLRNASIGSREKSP